MSTIGRGKKTFIYCLDSLSLDTEEQTCKFERLRYFLTKIPYKPEDMFLRYYMLANACSGFRYLTTLPVVKGFGLTSFVRIYFKRCHFMKW